MENEIATKRKITNIELKKIVGLKSMAYNDYIAARVLLQGGLLHQAVFFINTCIEKELKAYLFAFNINVKLNHDTEKLFNEVLKIENVKWTDKINKEFIQVINKIYKSRYFETLHPGYNFVINRNKFLVELDHTYNLLYSKTKLGGPNEMIQKSIYEISIENKNPQVVFNNYILNNMDKKHVLNQPDLVHEFRVTDSHAIIEMTYQIQKNEDHENLTTKA